MDGFYQALGMMCQNTNGAQRYFIFTSKFSSENHWHTLSAGQFNILRAPVSNWLSKRYNTNWDVVGTIKIIETPLPDYPSLFFDATKL